MRARNKPWADNYLNENKEIVEQEPTHYKGDWKNTHTGNKPIYLEIGVGKGQFIEGMAKQMPSVHFIGLELAKSILVSAVEKVITSQVKNVTLLNENAAHLTEIFSDNEIDKIFLNFSDPWPKNRHEKRRLTYHTFLEQYKTILKKDGEVILKTDNKELFAYSLESFSQFGCTLEEVTLDLHELEDETNVMTEYEEKFSAKGSPIYRCRARFS